MAIFTSTPISTTDATVYFGEIVADDDLGAYAELDDGIYTDYFIKNRYEYQRRICMMGVTDTYPESTESSAAFVQLAAPTLLWVADWTASRLGGKPTLPSPTAGITGSSNNWVLLHEHYEPAMISLGADGQSLLYRISGTYVYGSKDPSIDTSEDMSYPVPPWLDTDNAEVAVSREIEETEYGNNLLL